MRTTLSDFGGGDFFLLLKTHNDLFNLHSIELSSGLDTWAVFALGFDTKVSITMHARS